MFANPKAKALDPTCGDGQFLSEVIIYKMENGLTYEQALATTFGADIMADNCRECIRRLYGDGIILTIKRGDKGFPENYDEKGIIAVFIHNGKLVENIVQADGLEYDYNFGRKETQEERLENIGLPASIFD